MSAFTLAIYGFLLGAVVGLVFGLISHAFTAGRRDFSSVGSMQADRYVIVADDLDQAGKARVGLNFPR